MDEIKSKKNGLIRLRERLKTNEFKPSIDSNSFGQLYLFDALYDPFNSKILACNQHIDLIKLCEFDSESQWKLIYRASEDGFCVDNFHSKCDGHSPTLSIFKAKPSGFVFGGYTQVGWDVSDDFKLDQNAFIFSLTNGDNKPCKMKTSNADQSIYCSPRWGPSFGEFDISIADYSNSSALSNSDLSFTYKHPKYGPRTTDAQSFLAGSDEFLLDEIEVYEQI